MFNNDDKEFRSSFFRLKGLLVDIDFKVYIGRVSRDDVQKHAAKISHSIFKYSKTTFRVH